MFTLEQLVSFGQYLLSDERIERVQKERENQKDEKLDKVHTNDILFWAKEWELMSSYDILRLMSDVDRYKAIRHKEIRLIQS